jgi:branched-chain amino acid transport system permease protein
LNEYERVIAPETGVFKSSYRADTALHRLPTARYAMLAFLLVMYVGVPLVATPYQIYVVDTMLVACIGALGLNLLTGYAGQISIGHGGFLGVGAFASALLVTKAGLPFWAAVPAAGLITALVGLVFGIPSVRIKGLYLAIATLAAQVIIEWALSRPAIAGTGSVAAPRPAALQDDRAYYFVLLSVVVVAVVLAENILRTRIGRALVAVRDQDIAASVIGVNVARHKLVAFGLSSFYAGIAGALLGHLGTAVNFEQFQIDLSIQYLAMIVIGGLGSIPGSLFGAAFITILPIVLRNVVETFKGLLPGNSAILLSSAQFFLFGFVIVVFMIVEPQGLARIWRNVKDYFRLWPFSY